MADKDIKIIQKNAAGKFVEQTVPWVEGRYLLMGADGSFNVVPNEPVYLGGDGFDRLDPATYAGLDPVVTPFIGMQVLQDHGTGVSTLHTLMWPPEWLNEAAAWVETKLVLATDPVPTPKYIYSVPVVLSAVGGQTLHYPEGFYVEELSLIAENGVTDLVYSIGDYGDNERVLSSTSAPVTLYPRKVMRDIIRLFVTTPAVGTSAVLIAGCGSASFNGIYAKRGSKNGRPAYEHTDVENGTIDLYWNDSEWVLFFTSDSGISVLAAAYSSSDDVATPDLTTTWVDVTSTAPGPTSIVPDTYSDGVLVLKGFSL